MSKRSERRRIRRSSPDSPQGVVPVLTVFASLVAVVAVTALSLSFSGSSGAKQNDDLQVSSADNRDGASGTTAPTTTVIRGLGTTSLFVTTTTPITTTTSTSTTSTSSTTLPADALTVDGGKVTFAPGQTSAKFTVHSSVSDGVGFVLGGIPDGMSASPISGTAREGSPVTVTLRITDLSVAASGTIVVVGADGSVVRITVEVRREKLAVTTVTANPNPVVCGQSVVLTASVSGDGVSSATASITSGGSSSYTMSRVDASSWSVTIPSVVAANRFSGTVRATDSAGQSASRSFAFSTTGSEACED